MMSDTDKKSDLMLLTVLLKHDQSKNLEDIQAHMKKVGWWDRFPVEGTRVVSWTVAMGLGQIVTLELPPALLPLVNVELERSAWGVFPRNATRLTILYLCVSVSASASRMEANNGCNSHRGLSQSPSGASSCADPVRRSAGRFHRACLWLGYHRTGRAGGASEPHRPRLPVQQRRVD